MVKEMSAGELEARCRKCMRLDVSDTRALARVLDRQKAEYHIVDDTHADLYTELPVTELVLALDKERCAEMNTPEYERVLSLMVYSFAVRLPTLRNVKTAGGTLTDKQIKTIYDMVIAKGTGNYDNVITDDFEEIRRMVKSGKAVPAYDAEWYKGYIYTYVPSLAAINNKNVFLLGSADILFTLFYSCLEEELVRLLNSLAAQA